MYDSTLKPAFVFDGHNILDLDLKKIGFNVYGIGKPVQGHVEMDDAETIRSHSATILEHKLFAIGGAPMAATLTRHAPHQVH